MPRCSPALDCLGVVCHRARLRIVDFVSRFFAPGAPACRGSRHRLRAQYAHPLLECAARLKRSSSPASFPRGAANSSVRIAAAASESADAPPSTARRSLKCRKLPFSGVRWPVPKLLPALPAAGMLCAWKSASFSLIWSRTLLTSGGAGERAMRRGFRARFSIDDDLTQTEIAGRTDSGIARQMRRRPQLPRLPNTSRPSSLMATCLPQEEELPTSPGRLLPGILPLLEALEAATRHGPRAPHGQPVARRRDQTHAIWRVALLRVRSVCRRSSRPNLRSAISPARAPRKRTASNSRRSASSCLATTPHDITCARGHRREGRRHRHRQILPWPELGALGSRFPLRRPRRSAAVLEIFIPEWFMKPCLPGRDALGASLGALSSWVPRRAG